MVLGLAIALGASAPTLADSVPLYMASFDGSLRSRSLRDSSPEITE
jgi:hypothetical protein